MVLPYNVSPPPRGGGADPVEMTTPRQREARTHLHWCRLAELTDGYRDLITDVTEHRRRLPVW
ncbi:hypothetical protein [Nocardia neocaledoniensis]|uniref:hypothetical protein n=1 Tax=Nocardia neocaledoniensis TaxID=236511 RepID=UPI0024551931|nr:hypothetical protein [Nocardia neocaledoniensis]